MDPQFEQTYQRVLADHKVCSLATTGPQGLWLASTYFAQEGNDLICLLTHGTKSLANIEQQPEVAFAIDSQEPLGQPFLQGRARVATMPPPTERSHGEALLEEKIPEIAAFMQQPTYDIVRLTPTRLYLTDFNQGWFPAHVEQL